KTLLFDSKKIRNNIDFDLNGNLMLPPGDYTIPVMTYCMKHSGASPDAHLYTLSKLEGSRAQIIRELNLMAPGKFSVEDIQITSWSLQAGLSYEEMTKTSQNIIDIVLLKYKEDLKESYLKTIEKKWNTLSSSIQGIMPDFNEASNQVINNLGEVGIKIKEYRKFKNELSEIGHNYQELSKMIQTSGKLSRTKKNETPWSIISPNVYARFITDGHFNQIGILQIKVTQEAQQRKINSITDERVLVDIGSLFGNPNDKNVQPLSFSMFLNSQGVWAVPVLIESPVAAGLILAAIIAAQKINWDSFFDLYDYLKDSKSKEVRNKIDEGLRALQEAHDELEKELKEVGIISGKTKDTTKKEKNPTREYEKAGGDKELEEDFDKLPGIRIKPPDGIEYKVISNDSKAIKRLRDGDKPPTLEIQPLKDSTKYFHNLRVKVRYK
ncbi:MAG: hypothetical protein Q7U04_14685, partial [Bacteriovorax sp.]|nr:hypothetical protein [Bacteriovorax sp.]